MKTTGLRFNPKEYWETRLSNCFNLQGVGDIGLSLSYNEYLYRARASAFRLAVGTLPGSPRDWDILDVGSGTGFYVERWSAIRPRSIVGSDITKTAVTRLAERHPKATFICCDISAPLKEDIVRRSFDVVTAFDVLFHIIDDRAYAIAISNLAKLVRPGGFLLFSDNLSDCVQRYGLHQVCRKESEVRSLLADNGLRIRGVVPMFILMNDPVRWSHTSACRDNRDSIRPEGTIHGNFCVPA
jgi:2-polyprenyl-3-methyl-5-hydroxy-6-metoxy-1,4-benzoquinol methylase